MAYFINFSLLRRNRDFRLLYIGQFISFFGTAITMVALPYQIYHETHSTLLVGLLSLLQLLPLLFTALLGGVFADRYDRRKLLLTAEGLLALGCVALMLNSLLVTPNLIILFIVASLMSAITGLHRPALEGVTQQLVPKEDFSQLSTFLSLKFNIGIIIGPAVGGLLIAHFGIITTFAVDFGTFFISLIAIALISAIPKPISTKDISILSSLKQGFNFARSRQELLGSYYVDFLAMIFGMPNALFPAIALHFGGVKTLGLLYAAPAVGGLFISLCSGFAHKIKRHGAAITLSAVLFGIAIIFFGLAPNIYLALFFLALAGAFDGLSGIFRMTLWNETIPTDFRGRLAGIEMISYMSGPYLGNAEAGFVAAIIGVTGSVLSGGILCVLSVGICYYLMPKFREYGAQINIENRVC